MPRILGCAASIDVRKVPRACDELGPGYDREDRGGAARPMSDPAFLAIAGFRTHGRDAGP